MIQEEIIKNILDYLERFSLTPDDAANLTAQYRNGEWALDSRTAAAYLAVRLPATLAVLKRVLEEAPEGSSLLDFGAGPGTAALAISLPTMHVEHNPHFIKLAAELGMPGEWVTELPQKECDLVLCSYSLGESMDSLEALWARAKKALIIIEPGTPQGYANILKARSYVIQQGGFVSAPCPHSSPCPLKKGWCHFSVKVERSALHRRLKGGTLGYEEEKYSYVILTRAKPEVCGRRIIHVPQKRKGHLKLQLCTKEGIIEETVTRKAQGYKALKKKRWGDLI